MNKVLVKSPPKVLVKAPATMTASGKGTGVGVDYDVSGKPVFVLGQGGGAGRGKTGAEKFFGRAGGALSALGGFLGAGGAQHRSIGSALSGGIGAGYQGAALGGQLGRFLSGRKGRALANLKEQQAQDAADIAAHKELGIPLPKRLGGAGPVKVQSSKPKADSSSTSGEEVEDPYVGLVGNAKPKVKVTGVKDVTAAPTDPMDTENQEAAAAVVNAASKNPENRIEPGQRETGTKVKVENWQDDPDIAPWKWKQGDPIEETTAEFLQKPPVDASGNPVGETPKAAVNGHAVSRMPPPAGTVAQPNTMAPDENALFNDPNNRDHDAELNTMEPPKGEQPTLTSSEEQKNAIANQEKREEQKRLVEAAQQRREAGFKQQTLFGKMVKVE